MAIVGSDWALNVDGLGGRVRCHGSADIVAGPNMDWARVSGDAYALQKLKIYFLIPKGEVINDPEVGCCLHEYIFDRLTVESMLALENDLLSELQAQLPELGATSVRVTKETEDSLRVVINGPNATMILNALELAQAAFVDTFAAEAYA